MIRCCALLLLVVARLGPGASGATGETFTVVTFNVGTTERLAHDEGPDDDWGSEQARISDEHYGDSLAWPPAIEAARRFFAEVDADLVGFQEILGVEDCAQVPAELRVGFVCEGWRTGDPAVAHRVLGDGYQVACHPGKPDLCLATRRSFGTIRGCRSELCLDHLEGFPIEGCGRGARVGRAVIDLVDRGELTVVHLHATSGAEERDDRCRVRQVEQIFVDLGDGEPAANGERNLVLGDLNTDPYLSFETRASARRWRDFVAVAPASDRPFRFLSEVGPDAPRGYLDRWDIDQVIGDAFEGDCWVAGVGGREPVLEDALYFDHRPVVCTLGERSIPSVD